MTENDNLNSNTPEEEEQIQVHIPPDLEYLYRDVVNIFVGAGDVVMEFGNTHRSIPGHHISISNRIVLSVPNAYDLHMRLGQVLQEAQLKMQQSLQAQK